VRAARLLQSEAGCALGVNIAVEKHIPMGGGLGGGSSDAATTLIALNRLWSLGLPRARLMQLACAWRGCAGIRVRRECVCRRRGEKLQAYRCRAWYVVLFPPCRCRPRRFLRIRN